MLRRLGGRYNIRRFITDTLRRNVQPPQSRFCPERMPLYRARQRLRRVCLRYAKITSRHVAAADGRDIEMRCHACRLRYTRDAVARPANR